MCPSRRGQRLIRPEGALPLDIGNSLCSGFVGLLYFTIALKALPKGAYQSAFVGFVAFVCQTKLSRVVLTKHLLQQLRGIRFFTSVSQRPSK